MGVFTWTFANRNNAKLSYEGKGFVACPDGTFIEELSYKGNGIFGGRDIFELLVDWNRMYLKEVFDTLEKELMMKHQMEYKRIAMAAMEDDEKGNQMAMQVFANQPRMYISEWKRILGCILAISGVIPYPIKIVSNKNKKYEELPESLSCQ